MNITHALRTVALFVAVVAKLAAFPVVLAAHSVASSDVSFPASKFAPVALKVGAVVSLVVSAGAVVA